ncbi:MAG TPA: hypothetical protein VK083_15815 [Nocardia sp.]|uniref:hypothetical protein n=1 Tax=Nocardia TaxID=1817 RepID=UPI00245425BB|nr:MULTISPECIES: hypothetical protein [Nocardia]HLS78249.1 hypothetical protein [Nocardia sp.]
MTSCDVVLVLLVLALAALTLLLVRPPRSELDESGRAEAERGEEDPASPER